MRSRGLGLAVGCAVMGALLAPSPARAGGQYTSVYDVTAGIPAVVAEKQPDNSYVYYIREPGGELICRVDGSTKHYYHFDELGSTRAITDDSGAVTDRYSYGDYGAVVSHDRNAGSMDQPYQYVGQLGYYTHYQAPDFGRLQLGVRFYDPATGKFERRDPRAQPGTPGYPYVAGNPCWRVDPTGRICQRCRRRIDLWLPTHMRDVDQNRHSFFVCDDNAPAINSVHPGQVPGHPGQVPGYAGHRTFVFGFGQRGCTSWDRRYLLDSNLFNAANVDCEPLPAAIENCIRQRGARDIATTRRRGADACFGHYLWDDNNCNRYADDVENDCRRAAGLPPVRRTRTPAPW